MFTFSTPDAPGLIEAVVTAVSILGGAMAYYSGYEASKAMAEGQPPEILSQRINEGIAEGFTWGSSPAVIAFMILVWT